MNSSVNWRLVEHKIAYSVSDTNNFYFSKVVRFLVFSTEISFNSITASA